METRAADFVQELKDAGVRVTSDTRDNYTPGWKYNYWELKVCALCLALCLVPCALCLVPCALCLVSCAFCLAQSL